MKTRLPIVAFSILLPFAIGQAVVSAADAKVRVDVVTGPQSPELEQFAARGLAGQFAKLFDGIEISAATGIPADSTHAVLIGSPATNPAVKLAVADTWPKLGEQTVVIRSFAQDGRQGIVIGGGSPAATLWAVYEFGRLHGIRYLLRGDVFPEQKQQLKLSGFDLAVAPLLKTRAWQASNEFALGFGSWSARNFEKLLQQLAKLKFNRLVLDVSPWQPFVDYEYGTIRKQSALLWDGRQYPVDGNTAGKKVFSGARFFENPDFAGKTNGKELTAAGVEHLQAIIDAAHRLGMTCGLSVSPFEFPKEFQSVIPGSEPASGRYELSIVPGQEPGPNDSVLKDLLAAKIQAYLTTYPSVDSLELNLSVLPNWEGYAPAAWQKLTSKSELENVKLEDLLSGTLQQGDQEREKSGERRIRASVAALSCLQNVLNDSSLIESPDGGRVEFVLTHLDPALSRLSDKSLPIATATAFAVDASLRRLAENRQWLATVPADRIPCRLALRLSSSGAGALSQSTLLSLGTVVDDLRKSGWDGFSANGLMPADLDPSVYFLSRAAWDARVTPESCHNEFWLALTGNDAAVERLWRGWQRLDQATQLIDRHDADFASPISGMMMQHSLPEAEPEWWTDLEEHYTALMIELYRSHGAAASRGRPLLFYYAKRSEYVLEYLAAVKAVRQAAIAKQSGDVDQAIEHLEQAIESTYNGITSVSDVVRDQSDRGLVAVLNEHALRPLLAEYDRLTESADEE